MTDYTLTAAAGAFALAGQAAAVKRGRRINARPRRFTLAGVPPSLHASQNGFAFVDDVAEWTATAGTARPYVLTGAVRGSGTFAGALTEGERCYVSVRDGSRYEHLIARFAAPNRLAPVAIDRSSNGGAAVNWPAGRRVVKIENAAAALIRRIRAGAAQSGFVYAVPVTGGTVTLSAGDRKLQLEPAGTLATLTVELPPSPEDLDVLDISTTQTVTALTVIGVGGASVNGGSLTLAVGASWYYRAANTTWYRRF